MTTSLLHERIAGTSYITLNRPEKHNALSTEMITALAELLNDLESDANLRAVILSGKGEQSFSAGTDIGELTGDGDAGLAISQRGQDLCDRIELFPVPVIAAINGTAAGGGCELALACHLRIASSNASFSLPETRLGLIPAYGGTQRLTREIGPGRATEIMLVGKTISAKEASELGLVNRVVPGSELLEAASSLAAELAKLSPLSIRGCLKAITRGNRLPLSEGLALEREIFASLFDTQDAHEGINAFLEKRSPRFAGK